MYRFASTNWLLVVIGRNRFDLNWELLVKGNLSLRKDTGLINSSPVVNMQPLIRLQHGCNHTIKIPGRHVIIMLIIIIITSIKNNCLKLKNEVGMAVLKSKQTRVVYRDNQHIRIIKFVLCTYLDLSHCMLKLKRETVISSCINYDFCV